MFHIFLSYNDGSAWIESMPLASLKLPVPGMKSTSTQSSAGRFRSAKGKKKERERAFVWKNISAYGTGEILSKNVFRLKNSVVMQQFPSTLALEESPYIPPNKRDRRFFFFL